MKFGVTVFPGSNCDHDTYNVIESIAHQPVTFLWHETTVAHDMLHSVRVRSGVSRGNAPGADVADA